MYFLQDYIGLSSTIEALHFIVITALSVKLLLTNKDLTTAINDHIMINEQQKNHQFILMSEEAYQRILISISLGTYR